MTNFEEGLLYILNQQTTVSNDRILDLTNKLLQSNTGITDIIEKDTADYKLILDLMESIKNDKD